MLLLRYPCRQEIMDESNAIISRVESYYDDETFSGNNLGSVTVGNVTLKKEWIEPAKALSYINRFGPDTNLR